MPDSRLKSGYDCAIIGSGFGGSFPALIRAQAGESVLLIERGVWPRRDESAQDEQCLHLAHPPMYQGLTPFYVDQKRGRIEEVWPYDAVGGLSVFYGCVSLRLREDDFLGSPLVDSEGRDSRHAWPFGYSELAPYYDEAERLLGVAGNRGEDLSDPGGDSYPQPSFPRLSPPSQRIWQAARELGFHPFHLPMAMNLDGRHGKNRCELCNTCDHYICRIEAKNDLTTILVPEIVKAGGTLLSNTRAIRIQFEGKRAAAVELVDQNSGEKRVVRVGRLVLAAGAIGTPHLLLSSGVHEMVPCGNMIGRHLIRHINGVMAGVFPFRTNQQRMFEKMVGISDFYRGDPAHADGPPGPWGLLQEISAPGPGVIRQHAPWGLKTVAGLSTEFLTNILCIAEDIPQPSNRVFIDACRMDRFGMPLCRVRHRYHKRDQLALSTLYRKAQRLLQVAGALFFQTLLIQTFSHAMGSSRMGLSPDRSVLDPDGRIWGLENVFVTDASALPTGGSVNPSLTIAANALRIAKKW